MPTKIYLLILDTSRGVRYYILHALVNQICRTVITRSYATPYCAIFAATPFPIGANPSYAIFFKK